MGPDVRTEYFEHRQASNDGAKADLLTARRTIDVTPELRRRIKVAAFQGGITVAEMLRDLLSPESPDNAGEDA